MARFVNKGTGKKPKYEIDVEASTSKNPHGTADKAKAANEQTKADENSAVASKGGK
jgi:hypothetical protein